MRRPIPWFAAAMLPLAVAGQPEGAVPPALVGVSMLDCTPLATRPGFRAVMSVPDGVPRGVQSLLLENTSVEFDGQRVTPFYVAAQDRGINRKPRAVLILLDISGSMNLTMSNGVSRFEVARQAVDDFLGSLDPLTDRVAVVPFESHNVVPTIRRAQFLSSEQARLSLASLPSPSKGDTALFASINAGIDVLEERRRRFPGDDCQLIVITDGKDDLGRDPDPELLQHPVSLEAVSARVEGSSVSVYPIGIGTAQDTDMLAPLETICLRNSHLVEEPDELKEVLDAARPPSASRLVIAFLSPYPTAGELQGRNHRVRVLIGRPGRQIEDAIDWIPAEAMQPPQAAGGCLQAEAAALSRLSSVSDNTALVRPAATLLIFTAILLICWSLAPRALWPERFAKELPRIDGGARWASGRQAPAAKTADPARRETDATYVLPKQEVDSRSSRLK